MLNFYKIIVFLLLLISAGKSLNAQNYCVPSYTVNCQYGDYISDFEMNTINNSSNCSSNGYGDYFNSISTMLIPGNSYTVSVTCGFGSQYVSGWIDFNNDGTFASSEQIFSNLSCASSGTQYSTSVSLSSSAQKGVHRMRIRCVYATQNFGPCTNYYYGEAEDYKVLIADTAGVDIAATKILNPTQLSVGTDSVKIELTNLAKDTITSFDAGYIFGGGSAVTASVSGVSIATGESYIYTFSTPFTVSTGGTYTLKVWGRNPNSTDPDNDDGNDTLETTKCTGISGNFTIDASSASSATNFQSFTEAVGALQNCGMSGSVTFSVAAGTYNENVLLDNIPGNSSSNTITFLGSSVSTTVLSSSQSYTFEIKGTDYVTVKNLTIENTNSGTAYNVHIYGESDYNLFDSCYLKAAANNYSNYNFSVMGSGPYNSGNFGNHNLLSNSEIENGYYAVVLVGGSSTRSTGNIIRNNYIHTGGYYCNFFYYTDSTEFKFNKVENTSYGMNLYLYYANNTQVTNSDLNSPYYNIYSYYSNYLSAVNNFMYGNCYYNIYAYNLVDASFWHNSIYNSNTVNGTYASVYFSGTSSNIDFRNNIVALSGSNASMYCFYATQSNYFNNLDYNNFYNSSSSNFVYLGSAYANINSLQGQFGFNNVVHNMLPNYSSTSSPYNLHLTTTVQALSGTGDVGITTDIDEDSRCVFAPSLGADESQFAVGTPTSIFTMLDTAFVNSPVNMLNGAGKYDPKMYYWYIDGSSTPVDSVLNLTYYFTSIGLHSVTLTTKSCSGQHDTTLYIYIIAPTGVPTPDFLSNTNLIEANEFVNFINLSTGGDTAWYWSVTPGTQGVDWDFTSGDAYSYQPQITFVTPGKYDICLTAFNRVGNQTNCKSAYIEVLPIVNMCGTTFESSAAGRFYDDGGKFSNYAANNTCQLLIDPCASSLTMVFKKFNVYTNYGYLKIWDGKDAATGKPFHSGLGFTGTGSPGTITAKSGKLYIEWNSIYNFGSPGWEAEWYSTPGNFSLPDASFSVASTGYTGGIQTMDIKNYDPNASYEWFVSGNSAGYGKSLQYMFSSAGQYDICVIAANCGGVDTSCTSINIINPTAAPTVNFKVDYQANSNGCYTTVTNKVRVNIGDTITLIDLSDQGPYAWNWAVSPSNHVNFVGSPNDQITQISFDSAGIYDVTLDATNSIGTTSLTKSAYIQVGNGYCSPSVSSLITDIGINHFALAGIDYSSASGVNGYSNYSEKQSACLSIGGKYKFSISRNSNLNPINYKVWVDYNQDGTFSSTELVFSSGKISGVSVSDSILIPVSASLGKTVIRIGASFSSQANSVCGPNQFGEFEDYSLYISPDVAPPVISLIGLYSDTIEQGRTYMDPGATAWDAVDGSVAVTVSGTINTSTLGTNYLYYNAQDQAGNQAPTVQRKIVVVSDKSGPVITLNGNNPLFIEVNNAFNDPGATAYDSVSGQINASNITVSGTVNSSVLGNYTLTYTACDPNNNCTSINRTVIVGDTTQPTITIIGSNPQIIAVGSAYIDSGATATDNYWNNLTVNSQVNVNINVLGNYQVLYSSTDGSGNTGIAIRTVQVIDDIAPVITLIGPDTLYIEAVSGLSYTDPGYYATDNYYPQANINMSGTITIDKSLFNQPQIVTYTATDGSGNVTNRTRVVIVRKTSKPLIAINGSYLNKSMLWVNFSDPGVTMYDAYYSNSELLPGYKTQSDFNKDVLGLYKTYYVVTDPSGNKSDTAWRWIEVVANTTGISQNNENQAIKIFPNPVINYFSLEMQLNTWGRVSAQIMDITGRVIKDLGSILPQGIYNFDAGSLSSGVYQIRIAEGGKTHNILFIKQ